MATSSIDQWSRLERGTVQAILRFNILLAVQLLAAVLYGVVFEVSFITLHLFVIPFVWIAISVMAVWYTDPVDVRGPRRLVGLALSGGFFLAFLALSGAAGTGGGFFDPVTGTAGLGVTTDRSLGWSPVLFYSGEWLSLRLIPYQFVGYLALSYLIYVAVLDISRSATAGVLGLVLCPGCTVALFAPVLASAAGLSAAATVVVRYTYELSTVLFVLAVALLYWEPTLDSLRSSAGENLPAITAGLAVTVAWLHLFHPEYGVFRLIEFVALGGLYDPRPLAFTLVGFTILAGLLLGAAGVAEEWLPALGMGLVVLLLGGYVAWHTVLHHGAFWPTIEVPAAHDRSAVESILGHLGGDGYALVSKVAEVALLGLLVVLLRRE